MYWYPFSGAEGPRIRQPTPKSLNGLHILFVLDRCEVFFAEGAGRGRRNRRRCCRRDGRCVKALRLIDDLVCFADVVSTASELTDHKQPKAGMSYRQRNGDRRCARGNFMQYFQSFRDCHRCRDFEVEQRIARRSLTTWRSLYASLRPFLRHSVARQVNTCRRQSRMPGTYDATKGHSRTWC